MKINREYGEKRKTSAVNSWKFLRARKSPSNSGNVADGRSGITRVRSTNEYRVSNHEQANKTLTRLLLDL